MDKINTMDKIGKVCSLLFDYTPLLLINNLALFLI
ncbi:hypothetical protein ABIC74_001451 [Mucilaginibacter rubeus]|jgi:hypothetical protein